MRAGSLIRSWIYGIGVFTTMTVSFLIAMSIAITGPPSAADFSGVQAMVSALMRDLEPRAERLGQDVCTLMPLHTQRAVGCIAPGSGEPSVYAAPEPAPPPPRTAEATPTEFHSEGTGTAAPEVSALLGAADLRTESRPQRRAERAPPRHQADARRSSARPGRRARTERGRPPIIAPRFDPLATLPSSPVVELAEITPRDEFILREPEPEARKEEVSDDWPTDIDPRDMAEPDPWMDDRYRDEGYYDPRYDEERYGDRYEEGYYEEAPWLEAPYEPYPEESY